jgi:hypothetical protein
MSLGRSDGSGYNCDTSTLAPWEGFIGAFFEGDGEKLQCFQKTSREKKYFISCLECCPIDFKAIPKIGSRLDGMSQSAHSPDSGLQTLTPLNRGYYGSYNMFNNGPHVEITIHALFYVALVDFFRDTAVANYFAHNTRNSDFTSQ